MQGIALAREGGERVHERLERIDVDDHVRRRVLGHVGILRDHNRNRVADIADAVACQGGLQGALGVLGGEEPDGDPQVGKLLAREDRDDAVALRGAARVDAPDPAVSGVAAHDRRVELALAVEVVDIRAGPGQQPAILHPGDRPPYVVLAARAHVNSTLARLTRVMFEFDQRMNAARIASARVSP